VRYSGGKGKIADKLSEFIKTRYPGRFVEPFCGGLAVTALLKPSVASDASPAVITLVNAIRRGWEPPSGISEKLYAQLRARRNELDDPLVCFAGHGASWGGKWFGGLARGHKKQREPVRAAAATLLSRVTNCRDVEFSVCDYRVVDIRDGDTVYCDPPYSGTTDGYATRGNFDNQEFWNWARKISTRATILVSEYTAPDDFISVFDVDHPTNMRAVTHKRRVDRLFKMKH
jgi:DNA adenine methylase